MLNNQHGVAAVGQPVQDVEQLVNVGKVQAGGGLVQNIQRAPRAFARQFVGQLDALRLPARERRGGLAQLDVAQPHVVKRLQVAFDFGNGVKKFQRLGYAHIQHVGDVFAFKGNLQGILVKAFAVAFLALDVNVGQELHLYFQNAVSLAFFTAAAFDVEGKTSRLVAAAFGLRHLRKQFAYMRKQADVCGRVGARRFADGGLVHDNDFVYVFQPLNGFVFAGYVFGAVKFLRQGFV